jgi:hypothetical protein
MFFSLKTLPMSKHALAIIVKGHYRKNNLIYKGESVCVCVCVSGIDIHTLGPILTKFGMGA